MEKMALPQEKQLIQIARLLKTAGYVLCDAIEDGSGMMSDAKSAVHDVYAAVRSDNILPAEIRAALLIHADAAWSAITNASSTDVRLGDAMFQIGESERYLARLAQGT